MYSLSTQPDSIFYFKYFGKKNVKVYFFVMHFSIFFFSTSFCVDLFFDVFLVCINLRCILLLHNSKIIFQNLRSLLEDVRKTNKIYFFQKSCWFLLSCFPYRPFWLFAKIREAINVLFRKNYRICWSKEKFKVWM